MAITDIQISEELKTNAPSIKYSGNEGPKSPQEMERMMSGGQPLPEDPTKPVNPFAPKPTGPVLPDKMMAGTDTPEIEIELLKELLELFREKYRRDPVSIDELKRAIGQMRERAAYGGIMGLDGRKRYGWGSWWQENVMDNYKKFVLGQTQQQIDEDSQKRVDSEPKNYENPIDTFLKGKRGEDDAGNETRTGGQAANILPAIGGAIAGLFTKKNEDGTSNTMTQDETALALADLKKTANILDQKQAMAAGLNFTPAVSARKYSPQEMIEVYQTAANGGRIGFNMGGGADMGAPQMNAAQATEEVITKIMQKMQDPNLTDEDRAFLQAQLKAFAMPNNPAVQSLFDNKEFMNSFIEQELNRGSFDTTVPNIDPKFIKQMPEGFDIDSKFIKQMPEGFETARAMGGRIGRAEGGLMDLGGMEKDYRAEGGFVPIGREEKADDVPARLSVNEFVFTADAVRNAGGGDIDEGARVMENMMKHLEAGGQVSEESQGMAGARDMFAVSERLSEVV